MIRMTQSRPRIPLVTGILLIAATFGCDSSTSDLTIRPNDMNIERELIPPSGPMPSSPSANIELRPTLSWQVAQEGLSFAVYLGRDPTRVVANNNEVKIAEGESQTVTLQEELEFGKQYYWIVVGANIVYQ